MTLEVMIRNTVGPRRTALRVLSVRPVVIADRLSL